MKTKHLVIDTAAFVKNVPLWEYGEEYYSIPEVIAEIRDKIARQRYAALPVTITMREPQPWAIKFINQFSKKTGDYASLSLADVKLLALTYELEIEARGSSDHLRSEPQKPVVEGYALKPKSEDQPDVEGFHLPNEQGRASPVPDLIGRNTSFLDNALQVGMSALSMVEQSSETAVENGCRNEKEISVVHPSIEEDVAVEPNGSYIEESDDKASEESSIHEEVDFLYDDSTELDENDDDGDDEDDDDEGWITPSNIKHHKLKSNNNSVIEEEKEKDVLVACITSDFSIQNILRHIGLSVMGVDGKLIWQIRTFILRCYACFKTTTDMTKIFCPKCGNKTLKRVSVTVNPDGTQKIWINFKKPINTKGMRFSLPRPRGGQHARNPILVADQREVKQLSNKMYKKKVNPLHEDYDPDQAPFAVHDVYSRAAMLGYIDGKCHNHYYWERKNPNAPVKKSKKK